MPSYKTEARFKDVRGRAGKMNWRQIDHAAAIIAAAGGMSTATLLGGGWNQAPGDVVTAATNAPYPNVGNKANLLLYSASTNANKLDIPAPLAALAKAGDALVVDPANGLIVTLVAAAAAVISDVIGGPILGFQSGQMSFKRQAV